MCNPRTVWTLPDNCLLRDTVDDVPTSLPVSPFMEQTVNGVFVGGGVHGIALAGAAAAALDAGYRFDHLVGTSAGALVAALLAGYTADEFPSLAGLELAS